MNPTHERADHPSAEELASQVAVTGQSLLDLASHDLVLAGQLSRLVQVVADEAARSPRFARRLAAAVSPDAQPAHAAPASTRSRSSEPRIGSRTDIEGTSASGQRRPGRAGRSGRRSPGPIDPFAIYSEVGESGLRQALAQLDLEQLRDIIAEHGMDHDRLAMKWKNADRVIGRIIERVEAVSSKGFAFRSGAQDGKK